MENPRSGRLDYAAVEALSFDCYGTLIDWEAGLAAVLVPWARRRGLTIGPEELLAAYAGHESAAEAGYPAEPYQQILARSFRALGAGLGATVDDEDAAALAGSVPDWPAFPDSAAALRALGARFRLVILSNVDRASFAASQARLGASFAAVITAQDVGSYKPAAANFEALLAASAKLGIGAGKLLHVAQSLFHDHVPAQQAGLPTVWINRRQDRAGWGATPPPAAGIAPDAEFATMADFAAAATAPDPAPAG